MASAPLESIRSLAERAPRSVPSLSHSTGSCMQARPPLNSPFWGSQQQLRPKHGKSSCSADFGVVEARLFEPAIFEASKLKVLYVGEEVKDKRPDELPRAYTLTHSDITAKLTLSVSQTINKAQLQGWYRRLQRDEVVAEWKKSQGRMSLHVHCHISGGHWLLHVVARLRFYVFRKELPVVLEAFKHGDVTLFKNHPELEEALVWIHFHSSVKRYNRVECWGPLRQATKGWQLKLSRKDTCKEDDSSMWPMKIPYVITSMQSGTRVESPNWKMPMRCPHPCECCFPQSTIIPLPPSQSFEVPKSL